MCNPERKSTGCARGAKGCRYIHPEDPDWSRAPTNDIFIRKLNLRHPNDSEKMSSWGPRRRDSIHNTSSNRPPTPPALKLARAEVDQEHTRPPATSPQQQQTTPSTIKADVPKDPRKQRDKPPLTPTEPPQQQRRFSSSINPEKGSSISENKPLEEYQTIQPASMDIDDPGASQYITNVKVAPTSIEGKSKDAYVFFSELHTFILIVDAQGTRIKYVDGQGMEEFSYFLTILPVLE